MNPELRNSVERDEKGRVVRGGGSLNPGGVSKKLRRVRKALEKLDGPALNRLAELIANGDDRTAAVAIGIWAKYRLPVPKETKDERDARAAGHPVMPPALASRLAGMQ